MSALSDRLRLLAHGTPHMSECWRAANKLDQQDALERTAYSRLLLIKKLHTSLTEQEAENEKLRNQHAEDACAWSDENEKRIAEITRLTRELEAACELLVEQERYELLIPPNGRTWFLDGKPIGPTIRDVVRAAAEKAKE